MAGYQIAYINFPKQAMIEAFLKQIFSSNVKRLTNSLKLIFDIYLLVSFQTLAKNWKRIVLYIKK